MVSAAGAQLLSLLLITGRCMGLSGDDRGAESTRDLSILPALINAKRVADVLKRLCNDELGVYKMQKIFDRLPYRTVTIDLTADVDTVRSHMDEKLAQAKGILAGSENAVFDVYRKTPFDMQMFKQYQECCALSTDQLSYESQFHGRINMSHSCDVVPNGLSAFSFYPSKNLSTVFQRNRSLYPNLKWQYFISSDGLQVVYPAHSFDLSNYSRCLHRQANRHSSVYISASLPFPKNVVLLLDRGSLLSGLQLAKVKQVALELLEVLNENDRVAVIGISDSIWKPAFISRPVHATVQNKRHLAIFISRMQKADRECPKTTDPCGHTNHSLGFTEAFAELETLKHDASTGANFIMYVSRGLLSSIEEAGPVLETISRLNDRMGYNVLINTFLVVDSGKRLMLETTFMEDLATQNLTKYAHAKGHLTMTSSELNRSIPRGNMVMVNSSVSPIAVELKTIHSVFRHPLVEISRSEAVKFSFPYWDSFGKNLLISLTQPVWYQETFLGVIGLDLSLADFVDSVTYFDSVDSEAHAFLIDQSGYAIMHPKFVRPMLQRSQVYQVNVAKLESQPEFRSLMPKILTKRSGNYKLEGRIYAWKRLLNGPYILVISGPDDARDAQKLQDLKIPYYANVTYHRLDLVPKEGICLNMKQLVTMEFSGYFLSSRCFDKPFSHLSYVGNEERWIAQGHVAFLHDNTRLLARPGIKNGIRQQVAAPSQISQEWKVRAMTSSNSKYILRRYIASNQGALLMYPATLLDKTYDPVFRDWYQRALHYPGKIVITSPYLDPSGAGYMVTLSHSIFEGNRSARHSLGDRVAAVMGLDVTFGFLYKLLLKEVPLCREKDMRCFLFNDRGYVVAHSAASQEPDTKAPVEQHHLIHQEPLITSDFLANPKEVDLFVKKVQCYQYSSGRAQRYYRFNISYDQVLQEKKEKREKQRCTSYQIALVPNTNIFLAMVNQSCQKLSTRYCWCSYNDRSCINCASGTEATECECPCECPLRLGAYQTDGVDQQIEACQRYQDPLRLPFLHPQFLSQQQLAPCASAICGDFMTKQSCLGVLGCDWCEFTGDGVHSLERGYCGSITKCFRGVEGASPYSERTLELTKSEMLVSTPVGPVAGGILAVFVVLVVGVYCYRHQMARLMDRAAMYNGHSANSGSRVSSDVNEFEEEFQFDDGHSNNLVLASFERDNIHSISALHRRPLLHRNAPPTESSDHGYSTMTQNAEDSEQATTVDQIVVRPKQKFGSHGTSANDLMDSVSTSKLLLKGNSPDLSASPSKDEKTAVSEALDESKGSTLCASPIPGQTVLPSDVFSTPPGLPSIVTTTAQVHAAEA